MKSTVRKFIRHPSALPIRCTRGRQTKAEGPRLRDVGEGGICFECSEPIEPGAMLDVKIPLLDETHQLRGLVIWCQKTGESYNTGVHFEDEADAFRARMVEQVCYIEAYRQKVLEEEGRELSSEDAAKEWIERFARDFPER